MTKKKDKLSQTNTEQLIQQFIRNDKNILEKLYQRNYKIIRSFILKNNGTNDDAKDIFQEAMLIAWLNLKEGRFVIKHEFSLSAYIYKISKYKWLDKLKSKRVKNSVRMGNVEYEEIESDNIEYEETEKKLKYLNGLYSKLDNKCKEVLNQFYFEKKRLDEIAEEMNYDLGSIRTIKYRCMQKLRKMHAESQTRFGV